MFLVICLNFYCSVCLWCHWSRQNPYNAGLTKWPRSHVPHHERAVQTHWWRQGGEGVCYCIFISWGKYCEYFYIVIQYFLFNKCIFKSLWYSDELGDVYSFVCCNLQVYNEQIRDLLANAGPLAVREDSSKGVVVQGLTLHQVSRKLHQMQHAFTLNFISKIIYA